MFGGGRRDKEEVGDAVKRIERVEEEEVDVVEEVES